MYAVYHGPEGLKSIAQRVHGLAGVFALGLKKLGTAQVQDLPFFDTVKVTCSDATAIFDVAAKKEINLRLVDSNTVSFFIYIYIYIYIYIFLQYLDMIINIDGFFFLFFKITVAFDETTTLDDVDKLFEVFASGKPVSLL